MRQKRQGRCQPEGLMSYLEISCTLQNPNCCTNHHVLQDLSRSYIFLNSSYENSAGWSGTPAQRSQQKFKIIQNTSIQNPVNELSAQSAVSLRFSVPQTLKEDGVLNSYQSEAEHHHAGRATSERSRNQMSGILIIAKDWAERSSE